MGGSAAPRAAESARAARALGKVVHHFKGSLNHGQHNHLRDALHRFDFKGLAAPVPQRYHQLALIVRINQSDQIAQHNAVFVPQPRTRQDGGGKIGAADVDGDAGGYQPRFARAQNNGFIQTGAQIQACAARRGVLRQMFRHFRVEDFETDKGAGHGVFLLRTRFQAA